MRAVAVHAACTEEPTGHGHGTREEGCTPDVACMSVLTPDVSKLSGWLNADACCRGTPRRMSSATRGMGGAKAKACGGGGGARSVCTEEPTGHLARPRVRGGRT